jgi:hypothetical protein
MVQFENFAQRRCAGYQFCYVHYIALLTVDVISAVYQAYSSWECRHGD